jgi:hypothetical protein
VNWLARLLVRLIRRRRYREMAARIRALEVRLGLVEPTFTEAHLDPDLIDWGSGRAARREREQHERLNGRPPKGGYMAADVTVSEMGPLPEVLTRPGLGQRSPKGTVRPPVLTTQQVVPPPAQYVPE